MTTWRFCLLIWLIMIAANAGFELIVRNADALKGHTVLARKGILPGDVEHLSRSIATELYKHVEAPWEAGQTGSKVARAVAFLEILDIPYQVTPEEYLAEYGALTREFPDLRPVLASLLYCEAQRHVEVARSDDASSESNVAARIIMPVALAELRTLGTTEPHNALWSILLLHRELDDAVRTREGVGPGVFQQIATPHAFVHDPEALARARAMAQRHTHWERINRHATEWKRFYEQFLTERGLPGPAAEARAAARAPTHSSSFTRDAAVRALFLGYRSLQRGERAEARLWFDAAFALGEVMLVHDAPLIGASRAVRVMRLAHRAMMYWYTTDGDLRKADHHLRAHDRMHVLERAISARWDPYRGHPRDVRNKRFPALFRSMYTTATAAVATAGCAALWLVAAVWLVFEWLMQRRRDVPGPDVHWRFQDTARGGPATPPQPSLLHTVHWRFQDTAWGAALALLPLLLLAGALLMFPPEPSGESWPDPFAMALLVAVGGSLLAARSACRRVWQRLSEAGATGRPSRLWLVLAGLVFAVAAPLLLSGQRLPVGEPPWLYESEGARAWGILGPLGIAVAVVGVMGVIAAGASYLRGRHSWAVRAARTAWVVRALLIATLALNLATIATWPALCASHEEYWEEAAIRSRAEMARVTRFGDRWIEHYFGRPAEPTSQPSTMRAP